MLNCAATLQIATTQNANVITVIMALALLAASAAICHFLVDILVLLAATTTNLTNQKSLSHLPMDSQLCLIPVQAAPTRDLSLVHHVLFQ